ncbi:MAG: AAA family ATPase [Clostridia bacterium]|nr:AAA family ATPase [Clostridia bacterium]
MIIKKIAIDNFGKLSDFVVNFDDALNLICAPNESGKTTLMSFVKFAFYGTKLKKKKDELAFKEKYMPWNGMPMSGSIEFEYMGKTYSLYRSEGMKNGSKTYSVRETLTGDACPIAESPGKFFFGVDEASFSDSCFVQTIVPEGKDSDTLFSLSDFGTDEKLYSKAKEYLEEKIRVMTSAKRKESELSLVLLQKNKVTSELVQAQADIEKHVKGEVQSEKLRKQLNILESEIDDFRFQKEMIEIGNEYVRYKKLKEYVNSEIENIERLKEKIYRNHKHEISQDVYNPKNGFSFSKTFSWIIALSILILTLVIFALHFNGSFSLATALISTFVCVGVASVILFAKNRKSSTFESVSDLSFEEEINFQILQSQERIARTEKEIHEMENGNSFEEYETMSENFDINCFTNEEINDIIYIKGKEKEKLLTQIARLDALTEAVVPLKQKVDEFRSELKFLEEKECEIHAKVKTCKIALEILDEAFSNLKSNFVPRLSASAFNIFSAVAKNDSVALFTDENFNTSVKIKNEFKDSRFLSTATRDLLYLSLRIALCNTVTKSEKIPMFFDDVFASFDDVRCNDMLHVMKNLSSERQIIMCSCQNRERLFFESANDVNIIKM